jgi:hypothetical protein
MATIDRTNAACAELFVDLVAFRHESRAEENMRFKKGEPECPRFGKEDVWESADRVPLK